MTGIEIAKDTGGNDEQPGLGIGADLTAQLERMRALAKPDAEIASMQAVENQKRAKELRRQMDAPKKALRFIREKWPIAKPGAGDIDRWRARLRVVIEAPGSHTIVICGRANTGKTVLAVDLLVHASEIGVTGYYTTRTRIESMLHDARVNGEEARVFRELTKHAVLVIDHADRHGGQTWESNNLIELINARHDDELVTVLVTQSSFADLKIALGGIGDLVVARLNEGFGAIETTWEAFV